MKPSIHEALTQVRQAAPDMWEAAKLLVRECDLDAVPELLRILNDATELEPRVAAAWTLGCMHASAAAGSLIRILDDASEPPSLRDHAAEALGYLRDSAARDALVRNLRDPDADVVFSCAWALRTVGTLSDVPQLETLLHATDLTTTYGNSISEQAAGAIEDIKARANQDDTASPH